VHTTAKGNKLEDALYEYLIAQQEAKADVYDLYPAGRCVIRNKPKYRCPERKKPVEFDVVIELYRAGREAVHSYVVFECKNYKSSVSEDRVTVFSDQIHRVFGHSVKGVVVVASQLQSGADSIARSRHMGIVKFTENGLDVIADRTASGVETEFVRSQIFEQSHRVKSLKFSGYYDGRFVSSPAELLQSLEGSNDQGGRPETLAIPYLTAKDIRATARAILDGIGYKLGTVDLLAICESMKLDLRFEPRAVVEEDGAVVLGRAFFDQNRIEIYPQDNPNRRRFTIAHEIGHFALGHGQYLRSETVIKEDLLLDMQQPKGFNYVRLETQANRLASEIILPDHVFRHAADIRCKDLGMRSNIGENKHIYVDDQPDNYLLYGQLLTDLSTYFGASKQAIEIRLKKLGIVNDQRKFGEASTVKSIGEIISRH
jgi:Zn-dependent peptidase ImmA (M78 family)